MQDQSANMNQLGEHLRDRKHSTEQLLTMTCDLVIFNRHGILGFWSKANSLHNWRLEQLITATPVAIGSRVRRETNNALSSKLMQEVLG
jgi:hypothetical protein